MRHAKSAWPLGVADDRRPLNARGRLDAAAINSWFADQQPVDLVVVSPAVRTVQTAELAFGDSLSSVPRQLAPNLYEATWWDVLDVIRSIDDDVRRLVIVGHNPGTADVVAELSGPRSDPDAAKRMRAKFPTCAAAVLVNELPWSQWGTDSADLVVFRTPKDAED